MISNQEIVFIYSLCSPSPLSPPTPTKSVDSSILCAFCQKNQVHQSFHRGKRTRKDLESHRGEHAALLTGLVTTNKNARWPGLAQTKCRHVTNAAVLPVELNAQHQRAEFQAFWTTAQWHNLAQ